MLIPLGCAKGDECSPHAIKPLRHSSVRGHRLNVEQCWTAWLHYIAKPKLSVHQLGVYIKVKGSIVSQEILPSIGRQLPARSSLFCVPLLAASGFCNTLLAKTRSSNCSILGISRAHYDLLHRVVFIASLVTGRGTHIVCLLFMQRLHRVLLPSVAPDLARTLDRAPGPTELQDSKILCLCQSSISGFRFHPFHFPSKSDPSTIEAFSANQSTFERIFWQLYSADDAVSYRWPF